MTTLVKLVMTLVLSIVQNEKPPSDSFKVVCTQYKEISYTTQQLNPHYIITRDELLSHTKSIKTNR